MEGRRHRLAIVGSGPAAYTAAIYASRADLHPVVFEGFAESGGALMTTTMVENFPGFPNGVMGPELMESMRKQAANFGAELFRTDIVKVGLLEATKWLETDDGDVFEADAVIVATGSRYRPLGLPREMELTGHGVSWCATCDGAFFRGKDVVVIGGGDSALEEAMFLSRIAGRVTVIHRRGELRASKIMQSRAFAIPKLSFLWNSEVVEYVGGHRLSGVRIRNTQTGVVTELPAAGIFIAIGHEPRSEIFADQLELRPDRTIVVAYPSTLTTVEGVFACGDVVDGRYRQAITAAGSGCAAALDAERYLAEQASAQLSEGDPAVDLEDVGPVEESKTVHLTDETFSDVISTSEKPVLVDFWAAWCGPCRLVKPALDELAREYGDRVIVAEIDVDESPDVAEIYDITSMPVLKVFVKGKVVHTIIGAKPKSALRAEFREFLEPE